MRSGRGILQAFLFSRAIPQAERKGEYNVEDARKILRARTFLICHVSSEYDLLLHPYFLILFFLLMS